MRRLLLITPAELTRDQRARRAALNAQRLGLDVAGLCGQVSGLDAVERGAHRHWAGAGEGRSSPLVRELRGLYRLARLAARTLVLVRGGRNFNGVDVVHANDLDTLPAAFVLARRARSRLVYDAHELYSAFETDPPRVGNSVSLALERALARRADAVVTVSDPLARELAATLRLRRPPVVVLNAPERAEAPLRRFDGALRVVYQGSLGPGRPLDDVLEAAVAGVELTLRIPFVDSRVLRRRIDERGLSARVHVADTVGPGDVVEALREFEVGLIFDRPTSRNGELSLPNKFFEYLMAGLAVVTPRLEGITAIVEGEGVGIAFDATDDGLGATLERLAGDRALVDALRVRARAVALERLNAEAQAPALARAWGVSLDS